MNGHPDQWFGDKTYSQHGEDLMVACIFKQLGVEKGRYLDIGAHHPENISNTALLYSRGWRGINVEANPNLIAAFNERRPEDRNVCAGVWTARLFPNDKRQLFMLDPTSGRNTMILEEMADYCRKYDQKFTDVIEIPVVTIPELLQGDPWPDFVTIDVEGLDYDLLFFAPLLDSPEAIREHLPKVICVEVRLNEHRQFCGMMQGKGYRPYCRMGENVLFIREDLIGCAMTSYRHG